MLTPEDLIVIRAALRYFCEELMPHGPEAYASYLDEPLDEDALNDQNITLLCARLANCTLRWAHYSFVKDELLDCKLLRTVEEPHLDAQTSLATVLIPTRR